MGKSILVFFITSLLCFSMDAQNPEKIKGNKNVIIQETLINAFHTIDIDEDFEIEIIYSKTPSVEIEADENLHEVIDFEVRDHVLSFNKTKKITSKKRLNIKVKYDADLNTIITNDDAEIKSLVPMELNNAHLKTMGSSKADVNIRTNLFTFEGSERSKVKLDLISDSTNVTLNDNSKLDALINSPELSVMLYQRADAFIDGNGDNLTIKANNYAQFVGKDFSVKTCDVVCEISSDATIDATENVTIEASGTSSIYLYNNPKITINRFTDTTKLQKKVK